MRTSENIAELLEALVKFQKDVKQPQKDANNPFFKSKYVTLDNVVDVIHKFGTPHGLSEQTFSETNDRGEVGTSVMIGHSSGQYIITPPIFLKPDKNTPQGVGSAITYGRRYALSSAFGIASEVDDDGNEATRNTQKTKQTTTQAKPKISIAEAGEINKKIDELARLLDEEDGKDKLTKWIIGNFSSNGKKVSDIEKPNFDKAIESLNKMIQNNQPQDDKTEEQQESLFEGNSTKPKEQK